MPARFVHSFVGMKINFLVFHCTPQTFDENVIEHPAAAILPAIPNPPSRAKKSPKY
jgi:hypothetical protein